MLEGERVHLPASVSVSIDKMEQPPQLVEAEPKFPAATNEMQPPHMLSPVDAVAARAT